MKQKLPTEIKEIAKRLKKAKAEGYIVGGYVRDMIMGFKPTDIDVFTNLNPKQIQKIFPEGYPLGTAQRLEKIFTINYNHIEISTYRKSGDRLEFGNDLKTHLSTCDFTVNALAMDIFSGEIHDLYNGIRDINALELKFIGNGLIRIEEDALRMLRAVRFVSTRGFELTDDTFSAIKEKARLIKNIAVERIQEEFSKLVMGEDIINSLEYLKTTNLALYMFPEFVLCFDHYSGKNHIFDVAKHISVAVENSPKDLAIRLALFFHDLGKPISFDGVHFLGHENESTKITLQRLKQYKYPKKIIKEVSLLVENHMFIGGYYDKKKVKKIITDRALRRLIVRLGSKEMMYKLLDVRDADRYANSFRKPDMALRKKVAEFYTKEYAFKISDLKVKGQDVLDTLNIEPSKRVGKILKQLFDEVCDKPELNNRGHLLKRMTKIGR